MLNWTRYEGSEGYTIKPEYLSKISHDEFIKLQKYIWKKYKHTSCTIDSDSIFYLAHRIKELEKVIGKV